MSANENIWKPTINPWHTASAIMLAVFIFALDGTIANVALPHMAGSFSASRDESMWILTSYLIASGIVIPMVDWFSKVLGRKNFFMLSIALFTIASLMCGFSTNIEFMIISRIIQGFGGGGIIPIAQAILMESFPKEQRGQAMSFFSLGVITAPIIGPVLGGWITDNWSWPWIFFINVPFGILAVLAAKKFVEDPPYAMKQANVKTDGIGFLFLTIWLVTLQIVLDKGNNADWFGSAWVYWTSFVSVVAAVIFFITQLVRKNTLIDLSVFKDRNFVAATMILVVVQAILYATLAILPQFLQSMLGYTAYLSGATMMPRGIGAFASTILYGYLSTRVSGKIIVTTGLLIIGTAGFILGSLNLEIASMNIVLPNILMGFGIGFSMVPLMTMSMETLTNKQMTNASGIQNLLKNIGSAVGTSLVATMLTRFAQVHQHYMVKELTPLNPEYLARLNSASAALSGYTAGDVAQNMAQYSLYGQLIEQANLWAFIDSFRVFAVCCFVIIPLLLFIKTTSGRKKN
ncbi:MAG: DHA2 family efflux MFS transporter permease subunit [bacterium]|nr:DHA2 family efflux MFS transporter permease subunit [bacterium]